MINKPIFFERNRVRRVYTGGKLFSDFLGDAPEDGFFPEEWIASSVRAINAGSTDLKEGVSFVPELNKYFDELISEHPDELLGPKGKMRILVKFLDSAIRLPAQAHPDKAFSRKYFNSEYGKTECWIVLGTRPGAKIYFGFNEGVTEKDFLDAIQKSETDLSSMERLMKSFEPNIGDVYLVPAKTVHAIGAGCLILEVQEPTDFTIQPERYCGEYRLSDREMYLSLTKEEAVLCFDFNRSPIPEKKPKVVFEDGKCIKESLIDSDSTDCFSINRFILRGGECRLNAPESYGVYIVTEGEGELLREGYNKKIKKGDYFFMPYSLRGKYTLKGNLTLVECY